MMKKHCILILLVIILFSCKKESQFPKPNILWLVSEDNGPFLGAYGNEFAKTPNLDKLASEGVLYQNAFAAAPVCAPSRSTLITGVNANSLGTEFMRSYYDIPERIGFYPEFFKKAGYYVTNHTKKDYNTPDREDAWDDSGKESTYMNRKPGQPFFHVYNVTRSHESSVFEYIPNEKLLFDPEKVPIPPYHPKTEEMKHDWAQYYHRVYQMDSIMGEAIRELERAGLSDSTIIFYYSDHGGVMPRSKRYLYESGLHVPLIVKIPEMYQDMAPAKPGSKTDRLVTFVDFPKTVLSLAGIKPPDYMQGNAFLGRYMDVPREYAYSFRARMDEKVDLSRSIRDQEYRYIRNYMPHKVYGQHLEYMWRIRAMRSWEEAYKAGNLNGVQSRFFGPKPAEELYLIGEDPHNIYNLAMDSSYHDVLNRMRNACTEWEADILDVGFIPEPMIERLNQDTVLYDFVRSSHFPIVEIQQVADIASGSKPPSEGWVSKKLIHSNAAIRYWGIMAMRIHPSLRSEQLLKIARRLMLTDEEISVRIAAAEVLYVSGEKEGIAEFLYETLDHPLLMARTYALNLAELMVEDASLLAPKLEKMIAENPKSRRYDIRVAKSLIQ